MSGAGARGVALDVLVRVEAGAPSDRALDDALRRGELAPVDRGLATELVYGVLRRRASVDRLVAPHSRRPLGELDAAVLAALRLGAYQFRYLDRVPAHAAVDGTVEALKGRRRGAAGFVNAVLRALLRAGVPDRAAEVTDPFADVPDWWAGRWRQRYGDVGAAAWFAATLEPSPLVLRPHPRVMPEGELIAALRDQDIEVAPSSRAPGALRVVRGNPLGSPLLRRAAFTLRSEASQLVAALLPVPAAARVLDACAGRGGKTLQIAEDHAGGRVVAADLSRWRAAACGAAARAAALPEIWPVVADLALTTPFRPVFDAVLVDAPCSGLGTVRRRPELKWRNSPERLAHLAGLQRAILGRAADAAAPGAALLYVTCSTEPEENEQVVRAVLEQRDDLEPMPIALPAGVGSGFIGDDGYFRTYPHAPDLDGFFAALLRRR